MLLYNHSKGITDRPRAGKEITMTTYRVYIYYLRTAKHKDFDSKNDALNYAYDIANNNEKAMHITIENLNTCKKVLELYPER